MTISTYSHKAWTDKGVTSMSLLGSLRCWAARIVDKVYRVTSFLLGTEFWKVAYSHIKLTPIVDDIRIALRQSWADHVIVSVETVSMSETVMYPHAPTAPRHLIRRWTFDDSLLVHIRDVLISPFTGLAYEPNIPLLFTAAVGSVKNSFGYKYAFNDLLTLSNMPIAEIYSAMAVPNVNNWFHFLFEDLPGVLYLLERMHRPTIIVPANGLRSIKELLYMLNLNIIEVDSSNYIRCRNYYFLTHEREPEFVRPSTVTMVRNLVLKSLFRNNAVHCEENVENLIYISRLNSKARSMAGEEALEYSLQALGFQIVRLEEMGLERHIRTMRKASLIVGPHGAGLTHMLWAQDNCSVVEIVSHNRSYVNNCFASLACTLGFQYHQVTAGTSDLSPHGEIPQEHILEILKAQKDSL